MFMEKTKFLMHCLRPTGDEVNGRETDTHMGNGETSSRSNGLELLNSSKASAL